MYEIEFKPLGPSTRIRKGRTILEASKIAGIDMAGVCGGRGTCRQCRIQVLDGRVSAVTSDEKDGFSQRELKNGCRLACQTIPLSHCVINIPTESLATEQRAQADGLETPVDVDPPVKEYCLTLPAALHPIAGIRRAYLIKSLSQQHHVKCATIDNEALRIFRSKDIPAVGMIRLAVRNSEVVALRPWLSRSLGLAIDLGTTKIAGYLLDMNDGRTLAAGGIFNPQTAYGDDVITRLVYARESSSGGMKMQKLAVGAMDKLAACLCRKAGAKLDDIIETVIVGNTAMHHLALRLPVEQLLRPPFVPSKKDAIDIKSRALGLRLSPGSYSHFLPNVAGFVGADHVAMLLASDSTHTDKTVLAIDIGTNTEISLIDKGDISCVSCASGPAFEGGHIRHGMKASAGAIDRLQISDNTVNYHTIEEAPAIGLCGSAIIDAVSALYLARVLDAGGRMHDHPLVRVKNGRREFLLVSEKESGKHEAITITQRDIRELQLAKAAVQTGIEVLLRSKGIVVNGIDRVIVAGAFGSYMDLTSAITIGMLPSLPIRRFRQVGNAAGTGARMALLSQSKRSEARELARSIKYIELSTASDFDKIYTRATRIEPMSWSD